jgi:hypothetical protein
MGVGGQWHAPASLPIEEAGWAQEPLWTGAKKKSPPPGIDPRTVQSVIPTNFKIKPEVIVVATIHNRT